MMSTIVVGDAMYHAVHGLCKVTEVQQDKKAKSVSYVLHPEQPSHAKLRYIVSAESMRISGFHSPISSEEANDILTYFRKGYAETSTGQPKRDETPLPSDETRTWSLAECLLKCSQDTAFASASRKRNTLARAARGLVLELALVLKISPKEVVQRIQSCLQRSTILNPLVIKALENSLGDESGMH